MSKRATDSSPICRSISLARTRIDMAHYYAYFLMKKVNDEIRDRPIEKAKLAPVRLPFHIGSRLLLTRKAIVDITVNVLHFL